MGLTAADAADGPWLCTRPGGIMRVPAPGIPHRAPPPLRGCCDGPRPPCLTGGRGGAAGDRGRGRDSPSPSPAPAGPMWPAGAGDRRGDADRRGTDLRPPCRAGRAAPGPGRMRRRARAAPAQPAVQGGDDSSHLRTTPDAWPGLHLREAAAGSAQPHHPGPHPRHRLRMLPARGRPRGGTPHHRAGSPPRTDTAGKPLHGRRVGIP